MKGIAPRRQHNGRPRLGTSCALGTKCSRRNLAGNAAQTGFLRNTSVNSAFGRSAAAMEHRDEETIGLGRARRHQNSFVRQPRRLDEHESAFAERVGGVCRRLKRKSRLTRKESAYLRAV